MLTAIIRGMSRKKLAAASRTRAIFQHIRPVTMSTNQQEPEVLFESHLGVRKYVLNRPKKLNVLNADMIAKLRRQVEVWSQSDLCGTIVGTGVGRAFCAGGDIEGVVSDAAREGTRSKAIGFFEAEFELDYFLARLSKPYVVIMDGVTMGGGVGLSSCAPFRVATENTHFAMPETKIGFFPDVGGSFYLSRLDGQIGTYLALTGASLKGRPVFEHGLATHYVPSNRIPQLIFNLSALDNPSAALVDQTIEELYQEPDLTEAISPLVGPLREALDAAFSHDRVEDIMDHLTSYSANTADHIQAWAQQTLADLHMRSPTSLKVALQALRFGRDKTLRACLDMELALATAYCNGASPDFQTGVRAVLIDKIRDQRPAWFPDTVANVSDHEISQNFFRNSPFTSGAPSLQSRESIRRTRPQAHALPTEDEISEIIRGAEKGSSGTGLKLDELLSRCQNTRPGKHGVREKVLEVVQRRCDVVDNADGNYQWLKWKH